MDRGSYRTNNSIAFKNITSWLNSLVDTIDTCDGCKKKENGDHKTVNFSLQYFEQKLTIRVLELLACIYTWERFGGFL